MVDTAALLKRIVLSYDDAISQVVAEQGRNSGRYQKLRRERDALDELWRQLKGVV
jgi:hypothetical protein